MTELGRIPPQSIELEEAVLGAVLLEKDTIHTVARILIPESFYNQAHFIIYKTALDMFANNEPIDLLTVTQRLREKNQLDSIGGIGYITELTTKVNNSAHVEYHSTIIKEAWIKRSIINQFSNRINQIYSGTDHALVILDDAAGDINSIIQSIYKNKTHDLNILGREVIEKAGHNASGHDLVGVPSGLQVLDKFTSGWKSPDLIIIAARPSMGKTAFVLEVARNAALIFNKTVAIFSLEMSAEQCFQRFLSSLCEIDLSKITKGQASQPEILRMQLLGQKIIDAPIFIDDTPGLTITELRAKCHVFNNKSEQGLDLIVVDYLQLMEADGKTREQEIARISRGLKAVAKEFNVPVIALSQLSRALEARGGDKRPILSDLRESGAIEQDADMVGFLWRPEYYKINEIDLYNQAQSTRNLATLIWAKNRNGPLDELPLKFIGKFTKFVDWDTTPKQEEVKLLDFSEPIKEQNKPPF